MDETEAYTAKLAELEKRNADNLGTCSTGMCWRVVARALNRSERIEPIKEVSDYGG